MSHDEPDLLDGVREQLATGEPLDLLADVSAMVAAIDPRSSSPFERPKQADEATPDLDDLLGILAGVDELETTALLHCFAQLAAEEHDRAHARQAAAGRRYLLPAWLRELSHSHIGAVMEMVHVLGDGDDVMIELRLPGAAPDADALTVVAYIDHNLGTVVKDAFVVPERLHTLVATMKEHTEAPLDTEWRDLDPASARTRIVEAIELGAMTFPPYESDTWPACRPILEWATRLLPSGGAGYERPEWDEAQQAALTEAFFASPHASVLTDPDHRDLFDTILWFGTGYGPGDPLHWSPTAVEILLCDWIPRKIVAPADYLSKFPDLLRPLIAYSHAERGIRSALTAETLAIVDELEPEYQRLIRSPRPQGPAALLAAMGALAPDDPWAGSLDDGEPWAAPFDVDEPWDPAAYMLNALRDAVGGADALDALDDRPLPAEDFDWAGIDDDIRPRVDEILALCDTCCHELLDVEYRTACRRLLARAARGGPEVFRRRGRSDTAAAAICWAIGKANELFTPSGDGMLVRDLMAHFGLGQGSVSQRANTLLKAAGIDRGYGYGSWDLPLGDPALLVSARRHRIIDRRDRYQAK